MTSPKAPPMTDEPELIKRARRMAAYDRVNGFRNREHLDIIAAYEAGLTAAPRAGVVESMRYALRKAGDFVDDEIQGRTEAGGEETDYVLEAEAVRDVINGALALAAPPAVPDPHAELVAAAYAYRAAWLTLDAAKDDPATYGDPFSEITGAHYDAREALCRAAERLPDRDGGAS